MPTTIRGVIASRIDRLDAERRAILQEASVIGREFLFTILSQVRGSGGAPSAALEDALSALESADLIRKRDVDADLEYLFKHALTQEVAYSGLLRSKRHELHGRVARAMEKLLGERHARVCGVDRVPLPEQRHARAVRAIPAASPGRRRSSGTRWRRRRRSTGRRTTSSWHSRRRRQRDHDLLELIVEWELLHYYTAECSASSRLMKEHAEPSRKRE